MAFDSLSQRLQDTFSKLKRKGKIDEETLNISIREIRLALLDADVNIKVVKQFIASVKERALGQEVMKSLTPGQMVVKIVNEELTTILGGEHAPLQESKKGPTVIMMVGLQGAGKTTTTAKLAKHLQKKNKTVLLAACDIYRPAAVNQLQILGKELNVPVFSMPSGTPALDIAKKACQQAYDEKIDYLIIDTAGRLHVDEELMNELKDISIDLQPAETLLVVDAMTGQDAANVAHHFHSLLSLTGVILTKLDGDTRGGAALSIKALTGTPIKFIGTGEKTNELEPFFPERMASRILGMGDVLSLIEKAQSTIDQEKAKEIEEQLKEGQFTFDMFLESMQQMKKMGPLEDLLKMVPGANKLGPMKNVQIDEKQMAHTEAIILSMTKKERLDPSILNNSRKVRIAKGSGTSIGEVNRLIKQFYEMQKMMNNMPALMGKMNKKMKKKKKKKKR